MPTEFLKGRFAQALKENAGTATVQYFAFNGTSADPVTGTVNEATAYPTTGIPLPALIDWAPSEGMRHKIGLDITFDAVLMIAKEHLAGAVVSLSYGDAFIIPEYPDKFYVVKISPNRQAGDFVLDYLVAVSRKRGRR